MIEKELAALTSSGREHVGLEGGGESGARRRILHPGGRWRSLPLARASLFIDTLHPIHEWDGCFAGSATSPRRPSLNMGAARGRERGCRALAQKSALPVVASWQIADAPARHGRNGREFAPFRHCGRRGLPSLWRLLTASPPRVIGEMDCFYAGWMTNRESGFSDDEVVTLERLTPFLGLAIKAASLARIANTLVETYLGRDAGRRVLLGRIARGVADRIKTVLWFSELRNYARISDSAPPEEVIPLLDDYADAIVSAIHEHSGDVLKLIGDGVLAIFPAEDRARACAAALDAANEARASVEAVNERRRAEGLPTTDMYLGLHLGVVVLRNIGASEAPRLHCRRLAWSAVRRCPALQRNLIDQPFYSPRVTADLGSGPRRRFRFGQYFSARGRRPAGALYAGCAGGLGTAGSPSWQARRPKMSVKLTPLTS